MSKVIEPSVAEVLPLDVAVGRALHAAVAEHMTFTETEGGFFECGEGMFGAYHWCSCGWRSDDGPWPDRETYIRGCAQALITHRSNAMIAAVRDLLPSGLEVSVNTNTWATRDPETGRHHRNGHLLEMRECDWRCLHCGHWFDAAVEADLFRCGDDCAGKHPGDNRAEWRP